MNILFFLTPKSEIAYIYDDMTLRQVLEKMEHHRYAAIPIIDRKGKYIGTLTEGDLLWSIKNKYSLNFKEAEKIKISEIRRKMDNKPVYADARIDSLIQMAANQNFVPVIDDNEVFIGIVTRKDIIQYCYKELQEVHK